MRTTTLIGVALLSCGALVALFNNALAGGFMALVGIGFMLSAARRPAR